MMTPPQEKPMTSSPRTVPAQESTAHDAVRQPAAAAPVFRIRYGRLALAVAGLLSLLTGAVSGLLRIFGIGSAWLPVVAFLGAAAAVVVLRRLAVRDRRRKVNAAFRSAMDGTPGHSRTPSATEPKAAPASPVPAENALFDAQAHDVSPTPAPRPTALELRKAALAEAAASGDDSDRVRQGLAIAAPEAASWEPVQVPKPTYVAAAKAERAAPEPLDLPEAPKAIGKPSLKQSLAPAAPSGSSAADADTKAVGKGQHALSNLDDVLQRRRA